MADTRVALVCGHDDPRRDGVADYVHRLAAALGGVGVEALIVPAVPGMRGVARAARRIVRLGPQAVHVQFAPSAFGWSPAIGLLPVALAAAGRRRRVPLVTTLHEYGWWSWPPRVPAAAWRTVEAGHRWDRETLALAPASDALVVTNADHGERVHARLRREPRLIPIGANVADAGLTRDAARSLLARVHGIPTRCPLLCFFGFVHPVKGVRYLVEALPALRRRHGDVRVLVVGGFTSLALPSAQAAAFRAELQAQVRDAGVAGAVTITGHVPAHQVSAALRAADAVVLPYTAGVTTKSGALVAALDHGAPVAATAADPPDPDLLDGRSVVTIPRVRDATAVADAVSRLLDDAALTRTVAEGGRRVAAARSWPAVAASHRDLYRSLAPGPTG